MESSERNEIRVSHRTQLKFPSVKVGLKNHDDTRIEAVSKGTGFVPLRIKFG